MKRLTQQDWVAIRDALYFVLAGEWDQNSHEVTREQMEAALAKAEERYPG